MPPLWIGIDAVKRKHHLIALDAKGRTLLSQSAKNDEGALLDIISVIHTLAAVAPV